MSYLSRTAEQFVLILCFEMPFVFWRALYLDNFQVVWSF